MKKFMDKDYEQLSRWNCSRFAVVVGICFVLQTFAAHQTAAQNAVEISRDVSKLPQPVQRMRQAILIAAASGDVEQLRVAIDMNEIHPLFAKASTKDPVAYLKSQSADGEGREMLAVLFNLLTNGFAVVNQGTANEMIVWPYHAAIPMNALTPPQEVDIYRFLPPAKVKEMAALKRYTFYSVGISRDGVWHYFTKD